LFKTEKYLGFNDSYLVILGIPLVSAIVTMMIFGSNAFADDSLPCYGVALIFTFAYWMSFRQVLIHYHQSFPDYEFSAKRLFYISIRLLAIYIIVKFGVGIVLNYLMPHHVEFYNENKLGPFVAEISEIILIALVFFVYEGIYYFNRSRLIEIEKNKLQKVTAEQKLNTLKNQVNPHFLFNSLNTLVTLIPEDEDQAIQFVQELSKTYRTILEVRDEKLITIEKELEALDSYIYLLKTRFQGKILIINTVPDNYLSEFVLPISLQILIENAVKHNIVSKSKPLRIEICVKDNYLVVKNNLQKKDQAFASTKVGLTNIRSRYKFMTSQEVKVEETKDEFIVRLPIINNLQTLNNQ